MNTTVRWDVLDCSKAPTALFWGFIGLILAVLAHMLQSPPNLASVLRVGSSNPMLSQIERELGPVLPSGPVGHDGQLYYMIARDPFANGSTAQVLNTFDQNTARYRYRRILLPLVAGGGGLFNPRVTLIGLIAWTILGMGLVAIGIADIAHSLRLPAAAVLVGIVNLGALLSVMLVTADVLALGLSVVGVALALRRRAAAAMLILALASLTKETYWLVSVGVTAWLWSTRDPKRAILMLAATAVPLTCWSVWLRFVIPDRLTNAANVSAPFVGLAAGISAWATGALDGVQGTFAVYVLGSALLVLVNIGRSTILRSLAVPWLLLACVAGFSVWIFPTNAARAFSILWPLGILMLSERASSRFATRRDEAAG